MSKNERLFRTIVAGVVFAAIGVTAIEYDENVVQAPRVRRGLASMNCPTEGCAKLAQAKAEVLGARTTVLASHGLDAKEKTTDTIEVEIHKREDAKLREAGAALILMVQSHPGYKLSADETSDVASFLFETFNYDAAGIALDVLENGTDQERASAVVESVLNYAKEETTKKPAGASPFTVDAEAATRLKTFIASLKAYLDEGETTVASKKKR